MYSINQPGAALHAGIVLHAAALAVALVCDSMSGLNTPAPIESLLIAKACSVLIFVLGWPVIVIMTTIRSLSKDGRGTNLFAWGYCVLSGCAVLYGVMRFARFSGFH